ncbi:MAG: phosphorylase [Gammaproteobacteria bacterium]
MSSQTAAVELPGIVVALPQEARSFGLRGVRVGECLRMESGWLVLAGMGPDNAQAAAERLIAKGADCLLSWGIAGGLAPALRPGDLLIPDRIIHSSGGDALIPDAAVSERLFAALSSHMRVQRGALWSAPDAVLSAADKQTLATRTGVVAVDMESAAVAAVAARANLPFVAVKAICDPAERSVPPVVLSLINRKGRLSLRGLFGVMLNGPLTWRTLAVLRRDFADAQRTLIAAAPRALSAVLPA